MIKVQHRASITKWRATSGGIYTGHNSFKLSSCYETSETRWIRLQAANFLHLQYSIFNVHSFALKNKIIKKSCSSEDSDSLLSGVRAIVIVREIAFRLTGLSIDRCHTNFLEIPWIEENFPYCSLSDNTITITTTSTIWGLPFNLLFGSTIHVTGGVKRNFKLLWIAGHGSWFMMMRVLK